MGDAVHAKADLVGRRRAVVLAGAAVLFFSWRASRAPVAAQSTSASSLPPPDHAPKRRRRQCRIALVPEVAGNATAPLPALDESDVPLHDALGDVMGKQAVDRIFKPELLVRHIVVSIDNLSRRHMAVELRPTKPLAGAFIATGNDQQGTIDVANFQRYVPYVQAVQAIDTKRLAALYVRFYPLFQQAYQSLGYPNGYFNDRLIVAIDNLLATPEVSLRDIALVRPNVMYQFADPKLEQLSAGQKLLLRVGPQNAAIIEAKLRELRAEISQRGRDTDRSRGAVNSGASEQCA